MLAATALLVAVSAYGGAIGLMSGALSMGAELDGRLPFASPPLGGVALTLIVAIPFTVLALLAWRGEPRTALVSVVVGVVLVGWILVELAFIRELSFFHPLYAAIGIAFAVVGWRMAATEGADPPGSH